MTTAMQILSVERRRLTITLMYGIITAEKEFLRSRIFYFLIASISHRNGLDHTFDHLPIRTMWKQCEREHRKASFSDTKAPKSPRNQEKNYHLTLRVLEAASSSPATPTIEKALASARTFSVRFVPTERVKYALPVGRINFVSCFRVNHWLN